MPVFGGPRQSRNARTWFDALDRAQALPAAELPPRRLRRRVAPVQPVGPQSSRGRRTGRRGSSGDKWDSRGQPAPDRESPRAGSTAQPVLEGVDLPATPGPSTRGSPPVVPGRGSVPWYPMPSPTHSTRRTIRRRNLGAHLLLWDQRTDRAVVTARQTTRRVRAAGSGTANAMHRWSTAARRVAGRRCRRAMSASPGPVRTG